MSVNPPSGLAWLGNLLPGAHSAGGGGDSVPSAGSSVAAPAPPPDSTRATAAATEAAVDATVPVPTAAASSVPAAANESAMDEAALLAAALALTRQQPASSDQQQPGWVPSGALHTWGSSSHGSSTVSTPGSLASSSTEDMAAASSAAAAAAAHVEETDKLLASLQIVDDDEIEALEAQADAAAAAAAADAVPRLQSVRSPHATTSSSSASSTSFSSSSSALPLPSSPELTADAALKEQQRQQLPSQRLPARDVVTQLPPSAADASATMQSARQGSLLNVRPPSVTLSPAVSPVTVAATAASHTVAATSTSAMPSASSFAPSSASSAAAASATAPSTLSLLRSLQRLHQSNQALHLLLGQWSSSQSGEVLELEERLQRARGAEHQLRLAREFVASAGLTGTGQGQVASLLHSPMPLFTAYTSTSTAALLAHAQSLSSPLYAALVDPRRASSLLPNVAKPFGYAQELHYRTIVHVLRARPSLLSFALASFPWHSTASASSSNAPVVGFGSLSFSFGTTSAATAESLALHRKGMEQVAQCVVWDLFASHAPPLHAGAGLGGLACAGGGGGGSGVGAASGVAGATAVAVSRALSPDATHERKVSHMARLTLRIMWERETERMALEQQQQQQQQQEHGQHPVETDAAHVSPSAISPSSLSSSSFAEPVLPLHLLDHHAFLPKLLHELRLLVGGGFLRLALRDVVQALLLHDETDLSQDLMQMMPAQPPPPPPPATTATTGATEGPFSTSLFGSPSRSVADAAAASQTSNGVDDSIAAPPLISDPALAGLAAFSLPLSIDDPAAAVSGVGAIASEASYSPPHLHQLHGRSTTNLFDVCTTVLEKLAQHVADLPISLRRAARDIAKLCYKAQVQKLQHQQQQQAPQQDGHGNATAANSSPTLDELLPLDPNFERTPTRLLSDFFFLNWIVNALMFPESYLVRSWSDDASMGGAGGGGGDGGAAGGGALGSAGGGDAGGASNGGGGLTDGFPVSPLAKRNLQAVGTVLIKLTSGSRFSAFSLAARTAAKEQAAAAAAAAAATTTVEQEGGEGNTEADAAASSSFTSDPSVPLAGPPLSPSSSALPTSRLDRFLQEHQPSVSAWLRRVIDVRDEDDALEAVEMEQDVLMPSSAASSADGRDADAGTTEHITMPASATAGHGMEGAPPPEGENGWERQPLSLPPAAPTPLLLLPNDLFALHGMLRSCWSQAVAVRVASTPSRKRRNESMQQAAAAAAAASAAGTPFVPPQPVIPVPIAQLPLPPFPTCLRELLDSSSGRASSAASVVQPQSHRCPFPLSVLTPLLTSLAALGADVPHFVSAEENAYVLLDGTFAASPAAAERDRQLKSLRRTWPFDHPPLRHAADILLGALAQMADLPRDGAHICNDDLGALFRALAPRLSSAAGLLDSVLHVLSTHLPPTWRSDSFRPLLLCMQSTLLRENKLLLHSSSAAADMLLHYGCLGSVRALVSAREGLLLAAIRALQTKRLLELTRPKVRRLKKFLAARTAPPSQQPQPPPPPQPQLMVAPAAVTPVAAPVHSTPVTHPVSTSSPMTVPGNAVHPVSHSSPSPFSSPAARARQLLLGMLPVPLSSSSSFSSPASAPLQSASPAISAAVSSSPASSPSSSSSCNGACPDNAPLDRFLCSGCCRLLERRRGLIKSFMSKYVVGEGIVVTGGGNGTPAGAPTGTQAVDGATNSGVAPPPSAQSTSTGPLLVSVGVGPALDLRDAHVHADLSDYILASSYGETFLRCGRAEGMARSRSAEMLSFFQADFAQFTVLMHLMDWMPEVSHALAAWRVWRVSAAQHNDEQDATAASAAAGASPSSSSFVSEERLQRLGRRMGLEGHAVVSIEVPEEHLRGAGSRSHAPAQIGGGGTVRREVRIPYIGARPFFHALWLLGRLDGEARPKAKLALLAQVRAVLLTTLSSGSFTELSCSSADSGDSKEGAHGGGGDDRAAVASSFDSAHSDPAEIRARMMALCQSSSLSDVTAPSQRLSFAHPLSAASLAPVALDEVAQGSVEDFMTVLCFLVLVASSPSSFVAGGISGGGGGGGANLLSHLHFLRLLFPAGWGRSKAAVDCLVACKYLMGLWDSLSPLLAAEKAEADAKSQAMAREQQEATRMREQRMQEEQALRQQALELSKQIQDVDSQRAAAEQQQQLHQQQQQQQQQPEQHAPAPMVHVQQDSVVVLPSSAPDVTSIGVEPVSLLSPGSGVLLPAAVAAAVDEVVAGGAGLFFTAAAAEDTFSASDAYQQMLSAARAQAMAQQQQQQLPPVAEVQFPPALAEDAHTAPASAAQQH